MNAHSPIELETPRLTLRVMQPSDLDGLQMIFGDPIVMDAFNERPFVTEQT